MPDRTIPDRVFPALDAARDLFMSTGLSRLIFLAVVFQVTSQAAAVLSPPESRAREWARRLGYVAFLFVSLHAYATTKPIGGEDVLHYCSIGFRAFLALLIVQGSAGAVLPVIARLRWAAQQSAQLRRRPVSRPQPVAPPVVRPPTAALPADPADVLGNALAQAKREFEATCQTLRAAGLEPDELESALLFARQKYLRRVHGAMKQ